ncbi:glycosyltransferase family 4 protein [Alteromonas stellipolaris]|uniref:glycosyltransferase family 4 protein n=1 Tax=Alteromonas stellipolaris TaxID=233316 RepID=UPI0026E4768D|nr:glycosyltransferase family 4 protein [Alteromonas stellipolaris]MDO6537654.1 glycosyltransferase family 4 protein [Alteromonas stellipolaris]
MRIIHCVSSLQVGGAEKCVKNLVTRQKDKGLDVSVLSFGNKDDAFQHSIETKNVDVINVNGNIILRLLKLLIVLIKYSSIHIHSPAVIKAFAPIFPILLFKNVIYTIHGEVEPPIGFLRGSHKVASIYLNKIFAVSEPIKTGIYKRYGWHPSNVEVIKNGVEVADAPLRVGRNNKLNLCTVSRLVPLKNIEQLIENYADKKVYDFSHLHIYGNGPELEKLTTLTERLAMSPFVTFHGAVLDEYIIYDDKDVLLINSTTEGLPMSLLEAMARGIPALSTNVGDIGAVIDSGENGYVYDRDDMNTWFTHLKHLNENRKALKEMGEKAFSFIIKNYSIDSVSALYETYYS